MLFRSKGMSGNTPSTTASTKQTSGTVTPPKEANSADATVPATVPMGSVPSWADDAEAEDAHAENPTSAREEKNLKTATPSNQNDAQNPVTASNLSSPALGASSASTIAKDDDAMSLQNTPSEAASAWENKSQASTSVEKSSERSRKSSQKPKEKMDKVIKPLQEAPVPAVNIWRKREDERKAKVAQKVVVDRKSVV